MATTIERRVARLEAATEGGDRCPECSNGPDDDKRPYEVVFVDPGCAPPDEWCQTCGRALSTTIHTDWGAGRSLQRARRRQTVPDECGEGDAGDYCVG